MLHLVINAREAMSAAGRLMLRACNTGACGLAGLPSAGNSDKYAMIRASRSRQKIGQLRTTRREPGGGSLSRAQNVPRSAMVLTKSSKLAGLTT